MKKRRSETKRFLKSLSKLVLNDLLQDVGFTQSEASIFKCRYIDMHIKRDVLDFVGFGNTRENEIHNNILDKVHSHFEYLERKNGVKNT